jgi:hypothetical protein
LWTLTFEIAGSAVVPFVNVPKSSGCIDSSRCNAVVTSLRSVMMSYSSTPFFFAVTNAWRSFTRSSGVRTIGLSASTFNPASIERTMYSVFRALLPAMTTTFPFRSAIIRSR